MKSQIGFVLSPCCGLTRYFINISRNATNNPVIDKIKKGITNKVLNEILFLLKIIKNF